MLISDGALAPIPSIGLADSVPLYSTPYYYPTAGIGLTDQFATFSAVYRAQVWIHSLVNKLAFGTARLPLKVYSRGAGGERSDARDTPMARLLRNPNSRHDPFFFWLWTASTFEVYGEAMWVKARPRPGVAPTQLWPLHPANVVVKRDLDTGALMYHYFAGSANTSLMKWAESDIVHFKSYNPDTQVRGMSRLEPLRQTILNEDAARKASGAMWANGGRPSMALTHPGNLSEPAHERLKATWDAIHSGVNNWGKTAILEEGMTPHIFPLNAEEMQYIEARRINREEACGIYDVPPPVVHILDRATFCLPAGTLVSTVDGPVPVESVTTDDVVWAYDGAGLAPAKVSWSGQTGVKPVYTIRTANRTLRATGNHPVLVARRPHVSGTGNRTRYGVQENVWIPVEELKVGDLIVTAHGFNDAREDVAPNGRRLTQDFMEFVGLLMGDGWIGSGMVSVAHAKTAQYIEHYRHIGSLLFTQRGERPIVWQDGDRYSRFSSVSAARELRELGFSGTAHTKRIPSWVFTLSEPMRLSFLRGLFEADGSVNKMGRIAFGLVNRTMVEQTRELCIGLGLPVTNLGCQRALVTLPNGKKFNSTLWRFTCTDPGKNAAVGSWDPQDMDRLLNGKPFSAAYYQYAARDGQRMTPPAGTQLARVKEITFDPTPVPVYDLTVPDLHSFVADGVVVHNSNITEQMRSMYRDTMAPRLGLYESVLDTQLRPDFDPQGNTYAEFLMDEVMRGSFEARVAAYEVMTRIGAMMPSEVRTAENYPDGGPETHRLYVNAATIPLGEVTRRAELVQQGAEVVPIMADDQRVTTPTKAIEGVCATCADQGRMSARGLCRSCEGKAARMLNNTKELT